MLDLFCEEKCAFTAYSVLYLELVENSLFANLIVLAVWALWLELDT